MSEKYERIILVTDGTDISKAAEQTALNLAKQHSATVWVIDTIRQPSFVSKWMNDSESLFDAVASGKRKRLDNIAARFLDAEIDANVEVLVGKSSVEIARKAITEDADLVIRYMKGPRSRRSSGRFGTTARNLMRVCPCPLLLVNDEAVSDPKVLACVDAEHEYDENQPILSAAERLAGQSQKLLALYCWRLYGVENLSEHTDEKTLNRYFEEAETNYRGIHDRFVEQHDLSAFGGSLYMENGDSVDLIPEMCREEGVDVVVMSSASLNHPLHLLLGSTVESVLDELTCSLLVVKPIGFQSPIKPLRSSIEMGQA